MKKLIVLTGICSLLAALPALAGPEGKGEGEKGKRPGGPEGKGGAGKRPSPEMLIQKLDTDKSGGISLAEFKAGPMAQRAQDPSKVEARFNMMDADGNGTVDAKELAASFKKMQGRRGEGKGRPEGAKGKPEGGKGKPRPARPAAE